MSKLLSVNVGLPQQIEWEGRQVHTAIWKQSVPCRVAARRLNLDGDGQADLQGHGGEQRAVMVYQLDAYRYWVRELGWKDFEYGQFGENFTVDGLADNEVCIGDQYKIGSAVFEVTQPRVTCYRLGIRLNNPRMPALLVAHHRPGFYLRVIQEGEVGAGDAILKVADGPGRVTVAEIDSLLYLPNHDLDRIAVAARIPALSPGWKYSLGQLLRAGEEGRQDGNAGLTKPTTLPLAWMGFRTLRVAAVHQETTDVTSVVLEPPDGSALPSFMPGQYLALRLNVDSGSVVRTYSISGASDIGRYRISVKRGNGPGSRQLADRTRAGDLLETSAPRGDFVMLPGRRPVVLMSAGIGVTPLLSMLHTLSLSHSEPSREVWWIHAARNSSEHVFANETRELLDRIEGSHSVIAYSRPDERDQHGREFDIEGHLDLPRLEKLALPNDADVYLCGPSGFLKDMNRDLASLGFPQNHVHHEVFGPATSFESSGEKAEKIDPHVPAGKPGGGPLVAFGRSGLSVPWDKRFKSLLEFAEACDVPVTWSCRTGVCHMCECGVLAGDIRYSPEPLSPPASGNALICCSTPLSPVEIDL
jgi:ferredoxin-NADP reductase/MOSC domain-containing protein YiiM